MGTHLIDEYKPIDADTNQTNDWNVCFIYPSVENCLAYARKWMRYEIRFSDGQRYSDIDPEAMAAGFHKARV